MVLMLPALSLDAIKQFWVQIGVRNQAHGNLSSWICLADVTLLLTENESFFIRTMGIVVPSNFMTLYFACGAPTLKALAFVVNRLSCSVPVLEAQINDAPIRIDQFTERLRSCLFECDISGAFLHYRAILHAVDGLLVGNSSSIRLPQQPSMAQVDILLAHFLDREKAIGLIRGPEEK
jgi:hypothetical protein